MSSGKAASSGAPRWAVPLLAAFLVARSPRHYLRRLSDEDFARVARACERFILASTLPGFIAAFALLPARSGLYALLGCSIWGTVVMLVVGRRVALERRRRTRGAGK